LLLAFVGREQTLSEVSETTGMALNLLHHHVTRLLGQGLVEVVRERRRAGRAVRYYRATHDRFFVPSHLTARSLGATLGKEMRRVLDDAEAARGGTLIDLDEEGRPRVRAVSDDVSSDPWEMWRVLKLDRRRAAQFAAEVKAVVQRYASDPPGKETFLFHAAFINRRGN
jgi:DNA-binding transcriptional ArsR family regulator